MADHMRVSQVFCRSVVRRTSCTLPVQRSCDSLHESVKKVQNGMNRISVQDVMTVKYQSVASLLKMDPPWLTFIEMGDGLELKTTRK